MTIRELRALMTTAAHYGDNTEVTVVGVDDGRPLELTGEISRPPVVGSPIQLHSRVHVRDAEEPAQ